MTARPTVRSVIAYLRKRIADRRRRIGLAWSALCRFVRRCKKCSQYQVEIYFAGPLSLWARKPHPREVLARRSSRWLWLAQALAQAVLSSVDNGRCGYVVMKDGKIVHHERAKDQECNPAPGEDMHMPASFSKSDDLRARIAQNLKRARGK